jgi:DNA-directed RNA polymerase specialized sigma24 family protein
MGARLERRHLIMPKTYLMKITENQRIDLMRGITLYLATISENLPSLRQKEEARQQLDDLEALDDLLLSLEPEER